MSTEWKDDTTDQLCAAVLTLKNREDVYSFLEDIATIAEIKTLSQRLNVAKMLIKRKSYTDIAKQTGASTATISRVKRTMELGNGALKLALNNIKGDESND